MRKKKIKKTSSEHGRNGGQWKVLVECHSYGSLLSLPSLLILEVSCCFIL